jgi:uncharacterized protein YbjT (DUF2867 family)
MILVAGATGMVGGHVCRLLRERGERVRALVRSTSQSQARERLSALGCDLAVGDLRDRPSLAAACAGVQAVVSTVSAMPHAWDPAGNTVATVDLEGQRALIDAASQSGAKRFLLVTFSGHIDRPFPLRDAKRAAEQHLRDSGMHYTILRPSFFAEIWLSPLGGFDTAAGRVTVYGDGTPRISWISFTDVARFAVATLHDGAAQDRTIELGGPQALSPLEVVRLYESLAGRSLEVSHVPVAALEAQRAAAPDDLQRSLAALMLCYAAGDEIPMADTLRRFPLELTRVEDVLRRRLATATSAGA